MSFDEDEEDPSLSERLHEHFNEAARVSLSEIEYDLMKLREECEELFVTTGSPRAKEIAEALFKLEEKKNGNDK
jgi:hypothetical protein